MQRHRGRPRRCVVDADLGAASFLGPFRPDAGSASLTAARLGRRRAFSSRRSRCFVAGAQSMNVLHALQVAARTHPPTEVPASSVIVPPGGAPRPRSGRARRAGSRRAAGRRAPRERWRRRPLDARPGPAARRPKGLRAISRSLRVAAPRRAPESRAPGPRTRDPGPIPAPTGERPPAGPMNRDRDGAATQRRRGGPRRGGGRPPLGRRRAQAAWTAAWVQTGG